MQGRRASVRGGGKLHGTECELDRQYGTGSDRPASVDVKISVEYRRGDPFPWTSRVVHVPRTPDSSDREGQCAWHLPGVIIKKVCSWYKRRLSRIGISTKNIQG